MTFADVLRTGALGLRTHRLRAVLSGLGIAIGIASMVSVLGLSASSRADLLAQLDTLGTNLLRVSAGRSFLGENASLPESARATIGRVPGVQTTASVKTVSGATVRRNPFVDAAETGGISVMAADPLLPQTVGARLAHGRFLDGATARYPAVVLGADAARRLAVRRPGSRVWIDGRWFTVTGILEPVALASGLDAAALVGYEVAARLWDSDRSASTIYVRAEPDDLDAVRERVGATANPQRPEEVEVSRPSDALEARAAAKTAFTSLLLGLGAVALLVGGVGIANVMVISVLERRPEIGLRRALGARRRHVGSQFLAEALLLSGTGGAIGVLLGAAVTAGWAANRGWRVALPPEALAGGLLAAVLIGALAGLYPAMRAARLAPTEALRGT